MTAQFTPGPWILADENNQCCSVLLGEKHNLTCSLDRQDGNTGECVIERDEMLANARLIAAAPELLEALRDLLHYSDDVSSPLLYSNAVDRANAAIVQATGAAA